MYQRRHVLDGDRLQELERKLENAFYMGTFEGLREEIAPPEESFLSERALDAFREELAANSTIDPAELIQVIRRTDETERRRLAEIERQRQQAAAERLERRRQQEAAERLERVRQLAAAARLERQREQEAAEHLPSFAVTNPGMDFILSGEHQSVVIADSLPLERQRSRTNSELDRAIDEAFAQQAQAETLAQQQQAEAHDEGLTRQHREEASDDGVPNGDDERHVHPLDDPFRPGMVEVEDDDGSIRIIHASHREAEPTQDLDSDDESEGFVDRTALNTTPFDSRVDAIFESRILLLASLAELTTILQDQLMEISSVAIQSREPIPALTPTQTIEAIEQLIPDVLDLVHHILGWIGTAHLRSMAERPHHWDDIVQEARNRDAYWAASSYHDALAISRPFPHHLSAAHDQISRRMEEEYHSLTQVNRPLHRRYQGNDKDFYKRFLTVKQSWNQQGDTADLAATRQVTTENEIQVVRTAAERDRDREEWYEDQQERIEAAALELEHLEVSDGESDDEPRRPEPEIGTDAAELSDAHNAPRRPRPTFTFQATRLPTETDAEGEAETEDPE